MKKILSALLVLTVMALGGNFLDDLGKSVMSKAAEKEKDCEAGKAISCYFVAGDYAKNKNYGYALKYYNMGCDFEDDQSCGELGMIYATGKYGETNPQKAYEYWTKSAKLNPNNNASKGNLEKLCKNNPSVCK